MRASLDTNVIIHLYRAGLQQVLFDVFDEGIYIYEQIYNVELMNHGQDVLSMVNEDINAGKIVLYTDEKLKEEAVYMIFCANVKDNRILYDSGDLGEVYAISLAQTIGAYSLVTDDTKRGGPYMSLLSFDDGIMPFTFADILILRYLLSIVDEKQTVNDFKMINDISDLKWDFSSQITKFLKRFFTDPYKQEEVEWIEKLVTDNGIRVKKKFTRLKNALHRE